MRRFFIRQPRRLLIVPNPDEYFPERNGTIAIGAGGVARFVQRVAGVFHVPLEPVYLGKPYASIFEHNHRAMERQ